MALRNLALLLVFCILFIHAASDITSAHGLFCGHAAPTRKLMMMVTKREMHGSSGEEDLEIEKKNKKKKKVGLYHEELRTVPSGPDPLHHNGNTPKKPRTIP